MQHGDGMQRREGGGNVGSGYGRYIPEAKEGSEYGGIDNTYNTTQPKPASAMTTAEQLRLGYLTGQDQNWKSLEDRRQMMGLRPANGRHPEWLKNVSPSDRPELESEAERQGYRGD